MKKFLLPLLFSGASLLAGPLDPHYVADDAKWVAHVDMEKMLQSQSRKVFMDFMDSETIQSYFDSKKFSLENFHEGRERIEKIEGITFYGSTMGEGEGVAILEGDLDIEDLMKNIFKKESEIQTQTHHDMTLYSWKGRRKNEEVFLAQYNSDTYIISGKLDQVDLAANVMNGNKSNLSQSENTLKDKIAGLDAPLIMAIAGEMPKLKRSMVMKKSKSMVYTFSENADGAKSLLTMEFNSEEDAAQVQGIINGFKAFAAMSADRFKGLGQLAAKHLIQQNGHKVDVDLSFTPEEMKDWLSVVSQNIPKWINLRKK